MNATIVEQHARARLSPAELRGRWQRMLHDPMLADVPGKLELSEKGTIELSPASTRHGILQAFVAGELRRLLPDGTTITECAIETDLGIRVPDVAWASRDFMSAHGTTSPLPRIHAVDRAEESSFMAASERRPRDRLPAIAAWRRSIAEREPTRATSL